LICTGRLASEFSIFLSTARSPSLPDEDSKTSLLRSHRRSPTLHSLATTRLVRPRPRRGPGGDHDRSTPTAVDPSAASARRATGDYRTSGSAASTRRQAEGSKWSRSNSYGSSKV
jgi:hypothetical protein